MEQAIVIAFKDPTTFNDILDEIKDVFREIDDVHIYGAVKDVADEVLDAVRRDIIK